MTLDDLSALIPAGDGLVLDTSAVISYFKGDEDVSGVAASIIDGLVRTERNPGVILSISVAELLVQPMAAGPTAAARVSTFLLGFPGLSIRSCDFLVAAEAARIRAVTGAALADAMIAATCTLTSSRWLVTNDRTLRDRLAGLEWSATVLLLSQHL